MDKMKDLEEFLEKECLIERKRVLELLPLYYLYMKNLLTLNEKINLTAIKEEKEFILKHYIDSLYIMKNENVFKSNDRVLDLGTGGGFPGIPLAILNSHVSFTLLDSVGKKLRAVDAASKDLNLKNIDFINERAEVLSREEDHREKYNKVVSRAVADLKILSELALPLLKKEGSFFSYKGQKGKEEIENAKGHIKALGGEIVNIIMYSYKGIREHMIIEIIKLHNTDKRYPRQMKEIK